MTTPAPAGLLREAREQVANMPHSGTVWTGEPLLKRTAVLDILDAALAATGDSEGPGLDVERLAKAISLHFRRTYIDMIDRSAAEDVARKYARLSSKEADREGVPEGEREGEETP